MHNEELSCACVLLPEAIEIIIIALCSDYFRRRAVIEDGAAPYKVIMEYRFLNHRIYDATAEIVGTRDAISFIKDIGDGSGYGRSNTVYLNENVYKKRKREVKSNIAKRLSLYE